MLENLLIELRSEELPPKSLEKLSRAFTELLVDELSQRLLLEEGAAATRYATPRRLAVHIRGVRAVQPDRTIERKGPAVAAGLKEGMPTPALLGFAKSAGVSIESLQRKVDGKAEYFVAQIAHKGEPLAHHLNEALKSVVKKLPIPKLMRWGNHAEQFVRPVHGLVVLHGNNVVAVELLGLQAGNTTLGHRFLATGPVTIPHADAYADLLEQEGRVIPSLERRKDMIRTLLQAEEAGGDRIYRESWQHSDFPEADAEDAERAAQALATEALLDEVTALVEYPAAYVGQFDPGFLDVPIEVLALSMKQHQKYFPVANAAGVLQNRFVLISNMPVSDPAAIILGNERVLRARLSDARFFYQQDQRTPLAARLEGLKGVVYHNRLGTVYERVERLAALAAAIATKLEVDPETAGRAARLAKADLVTDMVGEFPELQGVMGHYYARLDGESAGVARAIEAHYRPRFAGDALPQDNLSRTVALADKLDVLAGIYGVGQIPTGDKDPFGLRRQALGVLRILVEGRVPVDLGLLLELAAAGIPDPEVEDLPQALYNFMHDRLKFYLREKGYAPDEIDAVLALRPTRLDDVEERLDALKAFRQLPEAVSLAAANKRIFNILKVEAGTLHDFPPVEAERLGEPAEQALYADLQALEPVVVACVQEGRFQHALTALAGVREAVDHFFDQVLVNAEDPEIRRLRHNLLAQLGRLLISVADISRLNMSEGS